ncbi:MAG: hypothetical protein M0C28_14740 [Candidatus Moduliflexus flocculans]|nr:hypothetical protein [Candidatus Moduliflexus flocculans]
MDLFVKCKAFYDDPQGASDTAIRSPLAPPRPWGSSPTSSPSSTPRGPRSTSRARSTS